MKTILKTLLTVTVVSFYAAPSFAAADLPETAICMDGSPDFIRYLEIKKSKLSITGTFSLGETSIESEQNWAPNHTLYIATQSGGEKILVDIENVDGYRSNKITIKTAGGPDLQFTECGGYESY